MLGYKRIDAIKKYEYARKALKPLRGEGKTGNKDNYILWVCFKFQIISKIDLEFSTKNLQFNNESHFKLQTVPFICFYFIFFGNT